MAIKPIISVSGVGVRVVTAEVITSPCVIVVDEIWMHVVDSIIHYGCCDVFASNSQSPSSSNVEIEFRFSTILSCIFKVPLMLEERIRRICFWWQIYQIFHFQRVVPTLFVPVFGTILHSIEKSFIMYNMGIKIFFNRFWISCIQCFSERDPR